MNPNRSNFLQFSSLITGFSPFKLEGTGLIDIYQDLIEKALGEKQRDFYAMIRDVLSVPTIDEREDKVAREVVDSVVYWPVVKALISLWYLGYWQLGDDWYAAAGVPALAPVGSGGSGVPCAAAYTEQLSYRAAGAHPPGAKPTGFGGWSIRPVFDETSY
jgi:hypothetical protein